MKAVDRFTGRVEKYINHRPGYPPGLIDVLKSNYNLKAGAVFADIGSGTGIFTRLLLENNFNVIAVEPNREMRLAAERMLSDYPNFTSVDGTAEKTGLPGDHVNAASAAQAFHWFDIEAAKREFSRILKPGGLIVLIWNERKTDIDLFHRGFEEALIRYCPEYREVNHMEYDDHKIASIFKGQKREAFCFENSQQLDLEGLIGRVESASYCPKPESKRHTQLVESMYSLFKQYNRRGEINIHYDCVMYCLTNCHDSD